MKETRLNVIGLYGELDAIHYIKDFFSKDIYTTFIDIHNLAEPVLLDKKLYLVEIDDQSLSNEFSIFIYLCKEVTTFTKPLNGRYLMVLYEDNLDLITKFNTILNIYIK